MRRNVASQHIGAQMITASDGTAFTGTVSVSVTGDSGTQGAGGGTAPAHEGNGYHSYTPTQAETNYTHVAFTFTGTGAIPATVQVYPTAYDSNGRADVGSWLGTAVTVSATTAKPEVDVNSISNDATAANNAELFFDGTGYSAANSTVGTVTDVTNLHASAATAANQTTLLNRIGAFTGTGVNTILGFFQALLRSDATLPTDVGGTYDDATDSLQAIRDHIGDGTNLTEAGGTGDHLTAIDLPNQTMDITGNLSGSVGSVTGAVASVSGNVDGNVTGSVGSLATQAKADVNAEVVNVINVDTWSELAQGALPDSPTIIQMGMAQYMALKNQVTVTNSLMTVSNTSGTVVFKKTLSDDGTTFTEAEAVSGP
jgi:hypothetical protein